MHSHFLVRCLFTDDDSTSCGKNMTRETPQPHSAEEAPGSPAESEHLEPTDKFNRAKKIKQY